MSDQEISLENLKMDPASLYREENFTDQRVGTLRRLTPVSSDGNDDPSRPVRYIGQSQMMTPMGPLPISFEIEADSLQQAVEKYAEEAKLAVEHTLEELKEMRRQAASQIVVPEAGGGMGGPGGMPGGGGIQMP